MASRSKAKTNLHVIRGGSNNFAAPAAKPTGALSRCPVPPAATPAAEAEHWHLAATQLFAEGTLTAADIPLLTSYARRMVAVDKIERELRDAPTMVQTINGGYARHPLYSALTAEMAMCERLRKELGLGPLQRTRLESARLQVGKMRKEGEHVLEGTELALGGF